VAAAFLDPAAMGGQGEEDVAADRLKDWWACFFVVFYLVLVIVFIFFEDYSLIYGAVDSFAGYTIKKG
jgi:hypothetical protein